MLIDEIKTGLAQQAAKVAGAQRRVRDMQRAGQTVRWAATVRRDAVKYLVAVCGTLNGWPTHSLVGENAAASAHLILMHADGPEIRRILPLVMAAAQKRAIPAHHYPELADALCIAEKRPQLYGTAYVRTDGIPVVHPIARPGQLDARRALFGMPPHHEFLDQLHGRPPRPRRHTTATAAPPRRRSEDVPDDFAVLDGLLADIEPVRALPRTTRRTVDAGSPWACGHCGGPAPQGSCETDVRGQTWRLCLVCADTRDSPAGRLDDVMASRLGKDVADAVTASGLAHTGAYHLPLRMELAGERPNHRPRGARWGFIPTSAICRLLRMTNDLPRADKVPAPAPARPHPGSKSPLMRLNELTQNGAITPLAETYHREGPDHYPTFTCTSTVGSSGRQFTVQARAASKQKARTQAAQKLLDALTGAHNPESVMLRQPNPLDRIRSPGLSKEIPEPEPAA